MLQEASWLAPAAYAITAARGLLRFSLLNAVFVGSGNLAASLAVAAVSDSLMVLYCELGRNQLPNILPAAAEGEAGSS